MTRFVERALRVGQRHHRAAVFEKLGEWVERAFVGTRERWQASRDRKAGEVALQARKVTVEEERKILEDEHAPLHIEQPQLAIKKSERVKRETGICTGAVGLITDPHQAEAVLAAGQADFISIARALLFNPRWGQHAAVALGADDAGVPYAKQYDRGSPRLWPPGKTMGKLGA